MLCQYKTQDIAIALVKRVNVYWLFEVKLFCVVGFVPLVSFYFHMLTVNEWF